MIETVERLCQIDDVSGHDGRLVFFTGLDDDFRKLVDQLCQRIGALARDISRVDRSACRAYRFFARVAQDAGRSRVGVLYVRPGLAVEIQDLIPGEHVVLDPVVGQFVENDGADADLLGRLFDIVGRNALFADDVAGLVDRPVEHVFQENNTSLTGGHGAVFQAD